MITIALSFLTLTSAVPLDTRATCHPQFGGLLGFNVSIINGGKEWSLTFLPPADGRVVPRPKDITNAEFLVRHRPSDDTYAIKYVLIAYTHSVINKILFMLSDQVARGLPIVQSVQSGVVNSAQVLLYPCLSESLFSFTLWYLPSNSNSIMQDSRMEHSLR
jgi:hypothetical protein